MTSITSSSGKHHLKLVYLLMGIFVFILFDSILNIQNEDKMNELALDLAIEFVILSLVLFTIRYSWKKYLFEKGAHEKIKQNYYQVQKSAEIWEKKSKEFIKVFQEHITLKFEEWGLSKSESEIALLILKGHSNKDISAIRFTSERTIRNQCRAIYEKSNLSGKNEFLSHFLNDLICDFSL